MKNYSNKYLVITTDIGLRKGGIQVWAHFIVEFLKNKKRDVDFFYLKKITTGDVGKLLRANLSSTTFILIDWKKLLLTLPGLLLTKAGILHSRFYIILLGDEFLNLSGVRRLLLRAMTKSRIVRFVSDSLVIGELFENEFGRKPDYNCYPFIDIAGFEQSVSGNKKGGRAAKKTRTFFTVSRLAKRKNIPNVVRALARIKARGIAFHYYIAGEGEDTAVIRQLVDELRLGNEVTMLGNISEDDKISRLSQSDLFLLPSVHDQARGSIEGFGIVFVEANAFGVPAIAGNTGGMKESVIDGVTGFWCDGTVDDIERKIMKALTYAFSSEKIIAHARKFDYREQDAFLAYLES